MSFILEALKKAEQKRREGAVPDLRTVHAPEAVPPRKRTLLLYVLGVVLLLNAGLLAAVALRQQAESPSAAEVVLPGLPASAGTGEGVRKPFAGPVPAVVSGEAPFRPVPEEKTSTVARSASAAQETPVSAAEGGEPAELRVPEPPAAAENPPPPPPAAATSPEPDGRRLYTLEELPPSVRREVPAMTLSLHFFSAAASSRMVRINGRNLREGDALAGSVLVEEITPDGVVFRSQGYRFEVPSLVVGRRP